MNSSRCRRPSNRSRKIPLDNFLTACLFFVSRKSRLRSRMLHKLFPCSAFDMPMRSTGETQTKTSECMRQNSSQCTENRSSEESPFESIRRVWKSIHFRYIQTFSDKGLLLDSLDFSNPIVESDDFIRFGVGRSKDGMLVFFMKNVVSLWWLDLSNIILIGQDSFILKSSLSLCLSLSLCFRSLFVFAPCS